MLNLQATWKGTIKNNYKNIGHMYFLCFITVSKIECYHIVLTAGLLLKMDTACKYNYPSIWKCKFIEHLKFKTNCISDDKSENTKSERKALEQDIKNLKEVIDKLKIDVGIKKNTCNSMNNDLNL